MTGDDLSAPELDRLRRDHPGWRFGSVWQSAASGPDTKNLTATRGGVLLAAATVAGLAEKIRHEEAG